MRYAAGEHANLLRRARSVTMSPPASALLPASGLWDGLVSQVARHAENGPDPSITADLAAFDPIGPGAVAFIARSGERRVVTASGGSVDVSIRNRSTKKYLTSAGVWQAAATSCLVAAGSLSYQVESLSLCQSPVVWIDLVVTAGAGVADWPRWNVAAVVGHDLDAGLTAQLRSSTDGFGASNALEATGTILQPAFLIRSASVVAARYLRVVFVGTNSEAPWYGEIVPCYLEDGALAPQGPLAPQSGYEIQTIEAQVDNEGPFGSTHVYSRSPIARRALKLQFQIRAEAELRQEIVWRSRGKAHPLLVLPADDEIVVFGRLTTEWKILRTFLSLWESDLAIAEDHVAVPLA